MGGGLAVGPLDGYFGGDVLVGVSEKQLRGGLGEVAGVGGEFGGSLGAVGSVDCDFGSVGVWIVFGTFESEGEGVVSGLAVVLEGKELVAVLGDNEIGPAVVVQICGYSGFSVATNEEAGVVSIDRLEGSGSVAKEEEGESSVETPGGWFGREGVLGDVEVGVSVSVEVLGDHAVDGRGLGEAGEGLVEEGAVGLAKEDGASEGGGFVAFALGDEGGVEYFFDSGVGELLKTREFVF